MNAPTFKIDLPEETDFEAWRKAARLLLQNDIHPRHVVWRTPSSAASLLDSTYQSIESLTPTFMTPTVPPNFLDIAPRVICHTDPERLAQLYRILYLLQQDRHFLDNTVDSSIQWLLACDQAIRRDRHKMHAFVRFRKVGEGRFRREQFAAWFEPEHYITRLAAPFFMRRFPNMDWVIVTPHCTAIWDGTKLTFGPGGKKTDVPDKDAVEDQWKTYFSSIFNPARLKVRAMMSEMPKKYWKNMPETELIPDMIKDAKGRDAVMRTEGVSSPHPLAETLKQRKQDP